MVNREQERGAKGIFLEQPFLAGAAQGMGVVAGVAQTLDEAFRAVRAIDDARADALDRLEQFVVIGVVGKRDGMIHAEAKFRPWIHGPAGNDEADLRA
jgi:hypothetical protein